MANIELSDPRPVEEKKTLQEKQNRGRELSRSDDNVKSLSVGLMDIDSAIFYYFENVIKPDIREHGERVKVPVMYANPERWASIQQQGAIRDKKRKIITPAIAFRRTSMAKDDTIPVDKIDPQDPKLFQTYQSQYTRQNRYDKLSATKGITPKKEMYAVSVPDYMVLTYEFIVWTSFTDQMNTIIERINWAEGAYWGEPGKFKFRTSIDSFEDASEFEGQKRNIKTNFSVTLRGYLLPESFNPVNTEKFITPKQLVVTNETDVDVMSITDVDTEGVKSVRVVTQTSSGGSTTTTSGGSGIFALTGSIQSTTNDLQVTGSLVATSFVGSGAGLTGVPASGIEGQLGIFNTTGSFESTTNNLQITGSIDTTGDITASNLNVGQYIYHTDDVNTYLNFTNDRLRFNIGGISYIDLNDAGSAPHDVTFNDGGNNVDLVIKGDSNNPLFKTDSSANRIGTHGKGTPEVAFHIGGSELRVDGNISGSSTGTGSFGLLQGDGRELTGVTAEWDGTHAGDAQITGSLNVSSSFSINDIEVDTSGSIRDQVLKFNGTKWVSAAEGSTFVFSIASFSDGESTSQVAGTAGATWKAADAITFTATYNNGPPTIAAISESQTSTGISDWTTPFATDDNTVAITYPNPGSTRRFQVIADGLTTNESSITFKNYIFYGASTQANSYDESFIEGLTSTLSEDKTQNNLSINASGNKYVFWIYPNRLGTVSNYFTWGTSTSNQVVMATSVIGSAYSVTNSAGLTENYKIYRSDVTVNESGRLDTGVSLINYIYWGASGAASGWDSDDIKALAFKDNSNDQTQVWTEVTGMTSEYILICIPSRLTDPASFWDNSTGFGADFESSVTVSVTNYVGYTENYDVFRSTNTVTGDFTLETK